MNKLNDYIQIISKCREFEAQQLQNSYIFSLNICNQIKDSFKNQGIKRLFEVNVLDYNGLVETQTSDLIRLILSYEQDNDYPIFKSFVSRFYKQDQKLFSSIKNPLFSSEKYRIDVCVKEQNKYALVIENKLKGAVFQRNQLGRYIEEMLEQNFKLSDIYLIIIPGWLDPKFDNHIRKSAWKAPKDWKLSNDKRKCCDFSSSEQHACWCDNPTWVPTKWCEECHNYKEKLQGLEDHIKIIDKDFADWLLETAESNIIPKTEYLLRSAMIQFAHYIKGLYKIRLNQKEIMESIKVITKELGIDSNNPEASYNKVDKVISDLNNLQQSLNRLKYILQVRIWQKEIENYFHNIRVDSDETSFGILIKGIYCGIWVEDDNKPYWGFYYDSNKILPSYAEEMVKNIISETTANSKGTTQGFLAWDYTWHGAERIKSFIEASIKLGYGYQRKETE